MMDNLVDELKNWIRKMRTTDPSHITDESLLALHLDGIAESERNISTFVERALRSHEPEAIDDLIVALQIEIEHIEHHWGGVRKVISSTDQSR